MDKTIRFHVPDFYQGFSLNRILLQMMDRKKEYFRGATVGSVFGCFPGMVWNGGRLSIGTEMSRQGAGKIIEAFNQSGVPVRFTMTNPLIDEELCKDTYCNNILSLATQVSDFNEVIVNSPVLENYIRDKFPKLKLISSTCKCIRDEEALKAELEKDYKYVVLDYNYNNQFDFIDKLPHKEKIEVLVNSCCIPECPRRAEHYKSIGLSQINFLKAYNKSKETMNPSIDFKSSEIKCHVQTNLYMGMKKLPTYISPDAIYTTYSDMGFENFKLEGRGNKNIDVLETYAHYFFNDECRDEARYYMLTRLTEKNPYFNRFM